VCRLCVAFQRIKGFEAVYAAGALCGVTVHYSAIFVKNKNIQVGKKLIEFFYTKLIINSFHQQMKQLRSSLLDI